MDHISPISLARALRVAQKRSKAIRIAQRRSKAGSKAGSKALKVVGFENQPSFRKFGLFFQRKAARVNWRTSFPRTPYCLTGKSETKTEIDAAHALREFVLPLTAAPSGLCLAREWSSFMPTVAVMTCIWLSHLVSSFHQCDRCDHHCLDHHDLFKSRPYYLT